MDAIDIIIWSCMLGGLITLALGALAELRTQATIDLWRGTAYVFVLGSSCVWLSGLPRVMLPDMAPQTELMLQVTLGPLSGAMMLRYLGLWLGVAVVDRLVYLTINWGAAALVLVAMVLGLAMQGILPLGEAQPLVVAALACLAGVALGLQACLRAYHLGDDLAGAMATACGLLALMVAGLYTRAIWPDAVSHGAKALIAACTLVHFFMGVDLTAKRNRQSWLLKRRVTDAKGFDTATGLPSGSVLLNKVDDAFWRANRAGAECAVIALHLRNLYAMGDSAGHDADQQILATVSARIRRAVGFRCLVGLYHPRCFVVVLAHAHKPQEVERILFRLRVLLSKPLLLSDSQAGMHHFKPQLGVAFSNWVGDGQTAQEILDATEQRALAQVNLDLAVDPEPVGSALPTAASPLS